MMVVVNRVPLAKPIDAELLTKIQTDFLPRIRQLPGIRNIAGQRVVCRRRASVLFD